MVPRCREIFFRAQMAARTGHCHTMTSTTRPGWVAIAFARHLINSVACLLTFMQDCEICFCNTAMVDIVFHLVLTDHSARDATVQSLLTTSEIVQHLEGH